MYDLCKNYEPECNDKEMAGPIYKLKRKELNDIKYVLGRPANRSVYDKSETFVRKDKEAAHMPSHGSQYMTAFG